MITGPSQYHCTVHDRRQSIDISVHLAQGDHRPTSQPLRADAQPWAGTCDIRPDQSLWLRLLILQLDDFRPQNGSVLTEPWDKPAVSRTRPQHQSLANADLGDAGGHGTVLDERQRQCTPGRDSLARQSQLVTQRLSGAHQQLMIARRRLDTGEAPQVGSNAGHMKARQHHRIPGKSNQLVGGHPLAPVADVNHGNNVDGAVSSPSGVRKAHQDMSLADENAVTGFDCGFHLANHRGPDQHAPRCIRVVCLEPYKVLHT